MTVLIDTRDDFTLDAYTRSAVRCGLWRAACVLVDVRASLLPDQLAIGLDEESYFGMLPMAAVGFGEAAQPTFLPGPES
jgi:hypothetical protein